MAPSSQHLSRSSSAERKQLTARPRNDLGARTSRHPRRDRRGTPNPRRSFSRHRRTRSRNAYRRGDARDQDLGPAQLLPGPRNTRNWAWSPRRGPRSAGCRDLVVGAQSRTYRRQLIQKLEVCTSCLWVPPGVQKVETFCSTRPGACQATRARGELGYLPTGTRGTDASNAVPVWKDRPCRPPSSLAS
jgi:hypothetical protein